MTTPSFLKEDTWLSQIIDRKAYHLSIDAYLNSDRNLSLTEPTFIQAKVSTQDVEACIALQKAGFLCVDTNVTFELKNAQAKGCSPEVTQNYHLCMANSEDQSGVKACAHQNFVYTRYHLDPAFTKEMADTIKSEWAGNYFSGQRGQAMVLAKHNSGRVSGFCQILELNPQTRVIDLIAVSAEDRRQGLAQGMILHELGEKDLIVGTQVSNIPSIRCYESMGFKLMKSQYVFHFHGA